MNLYPYTDFHELNDDWIISHIKKNEKDITALQNTIVNLNFEFDRKADKATTYTKTEVDNLLVLKADKANTFTKGEVVNRLNQKANISDLATVATTGSYTDLINKPTIPAAQVNSDWNANSGVAEILNKPTTLSGYGITDAYTENDVDTIASGLQAQITALNNVKVKSLSFSGTTNANGYIQGNRSAFNLGAYDFIIAVFFNKDTYGNTRRVEIGNYASQGFSLRFFDGSTPVASGNVSFEMIYVTLQ